VIVEIAGVADRTYVFFGITYTSQIWVFRVLVWVVPLAALAVTHRVCTELLRGERVLRTQEEAEEEAQEAGGTPVLQSPARP
jgi:hypothetical protein